MMQSGWMGRVASMSMTIGASRKPRKPDTYGTEMETGRDNDRASCGGCPAVTRTKVTVETASVTWASRDLKDMSTPATRSGRVP